MNNPLISICIPAYNASKYIGETLASIKRQTYQNWEVIVVEDATLDGTKELVEKFSKEVSQKVIYLRNEKTKGPAGSRNAAANASAGDWIAFLDSDDIWKENHLAELIQSAQDHPDCDLIHSAVNLFESHTGKILTEEILPHEEAIKNFPVSLFDRSYTIMPSQAMISRRLFQTTGGFDEQVKFGIEDMEMWFRSAKANYKFGFNKKNTCNYRKHTGALSTNALQMALGNAEVYDRYSTWAAIPEGLRVNYAAEAWFAVTRIARKTDKKLAKECLRKALKFKFSLKMFLFWVLLRVPGI
ncbi:glycosyltransferase family 2 protein [Adhaeribacter aquaticus]|uniref:glycosyltransferase family 2 protein n=1 Tax=Adhaeribacter aquaticus TaxID=299567 RepID=UPI00040A7A72|nr:glycosyltransferase family 2 protein [Adhaeribacter aquaticus]